MSGIYYFGYGAMVNPVSRSRRNVETVMEKPAVLNDFRLTFAYGGAGNILKKRGWAVHGVLMECKTKKDWDIIEEFDSGYACITVDVYPYGSDDPIQARVFVMSLDEDDNAKLPTERLPQERYVRIIAEGMRFHGLDDEYIDYQIMNVPYIPNRKPAEYLRFPVNKGSKKQLKQLSCQSYTKKAKQNDWLRIGNRVIQIGEHDPQSAFVQWAKSQLVGQEDCTWVLMQTLYDPDLPVCESEEDLTSLHRLWAENQLMEKFEQADLGGAVVHLIKEQRNTAESRPLRAMKRLAPIFRNRRCKTDPLSFDGGIMDRSTETIAASTILASSNGSIRIQQQL